MISGKKMKLISRSIKTLLVLLCFSYLFYKLAVSDIRQFLTILKVQMANSLNLIYLVIVLLLMVLNWSIEALKWKQLISELQTIKFSSSLKSIFTGVSISIITPNRAGEFAGKIFYLKKANKADAMLLSLIGSLSQVLVTFCVGLLAIYYYLYSIKQLINYKIQVGALIVLTIVLSIYLFSEVTYIAKNWKKGNFIRKLIPYNDLVLKITKLQLLKITSLSIARYMIFSFQYFLLLKIFNLSISSFESFVLIAVYFFFVSLIPTYALSELGIRGSVAIVLFCAAGSNCAAVFASSFLLWLINLAIPAAIGSMFVYQLKFFKTEDGEY